MIVHFQALRRLSFCGVSLLQRKLSTCSRSCCQVLDERYRAGSHENRVSEVAVNLCGSDGWTRSYTIKENLSENCVHCQRRKFPSRTQHSVSVLAKRKQRRPTPRSRSLQKSRRDLALMKLLHNQTCTSLTAGMLDGDKTPLKEDECIGETPVLFQVELSLMQMLMNNVSNLQDHLLIKEIVEEKIKQLKQGLHVDSVLGSAVPFTRDSDDIIIRSSSPKPYESTEQAPEWTNSLKEFGVINVMTTYPYNKDLHKKNLEVSQTGKLSLGRENINILSKLSDQVVMCSSPPSTSSEMQNSLGKPDKEHLELMFHRLSEEMPNFFGQSHDYSMYSQDLEFDNRLMGVKTTGLAAYKATVQSLKLASTAYVVNAHLEVLRLTMEPEEGCIHARWRIKGVPLHSFVLKPLAKKHKYRYFDAFSVFRLGPDGLIHHHRLDKVMPDSEKIKEPSLITKIGIALGLVRQPAISTNWMTGDPPAL
ncbi:hypothetical protein HOLleu_16352 [Holothuria leucospilota]|uniref:Uncharacterized protein n=1 Tax=Holothuria leucospilota TaxID=206669 RepID=A0A9Q1C5I6_HOLLE|nr:hypothetical protein HOLleu_16352 [Holothuria leucospilota]